MPIICDYLITLPLTTIITIFIFSIVKKEDDYRISIFCNNLISFLLFLICFLFVLIIYFTCSYQVVALMQGSNAGSNWGSFFSIPSGLPGAILFLAFVLTIFFLFAAFLVNFLFFPLGYLFYLFFPVSFVAFSNDYVRLKRDLYVPALVHFIFKQLFSLQGIGHFKINFYTNPSLLPMCSVFGHGYKHFGVYLSRGLIDSLTNNKITERELKAILQHELFHIKNNMFFEMHNRLIFQTGYFYNILLSFSSLIVIILIYSISYSAEAYQLFCQTFAGKLNYFLGFILSYLILRLIFTKNWIDSELLADLNITSNGYTPEETMHLISKLNLCSTANEKRSRLVSFLSALSSLLIPKGNTKPTTNDRYDNLESAGQALSTPSIPDTIIFEIKIMVLLLITFIVYGALFSLLVKKGNIYLYSMLINIVFLTIITNILLIRFRKSAGSEII